jgi:tripartite-type tricarboxylate transporter receptor subunit TctC
VTLMSSEMARIVKTPQMQQKLRDLNLEPLGSNASDFATVLANDLGSWAKLVTELGIHED